MNKHPEWTEVADRVFVWRQPVLDVNSTLIVGETGALVVDTLSTRAQAAELAEHVRWVTKLPWRVVNTHAHFDHSFGNAVLAPDDGTDVWAHERCAEVMEQIDDAQLALLAGEFPELADDIRTVRLRPPNRTFHTDAELDIGDRVVRLLHTGRGHTDHDLSVLVTDPLLGEHALLTGDLIEESGPPMFGDAYPLDWPETVSALLPYASGVVVPGHGTPVDAAFMAAQHAQLVELEWLCRDGHADGAPVAEVAAKSPFGSKVSMVAVQRAYADLDGRI